MFFYEKCDLLLGKGFITTTSVKKNTINYNSGSQFNNSEVM